MKKIDLIVKNCFECPYIEYNSNYSRSYNSGFDCKHEQGPGRVIDDDAEIKGNRDTFIHEKCPLKESQ